jgi:hypothetical protein
MKNFCVWPLVSGEFAVIIDGEGGNPPDPQSIWTIVRFASERDAQRWAQDARTGKEGSEPRESIAHAEFDYFWEDVVCLAYAMDCEHAETRRAKLTYFLDHFPEPDPRASFESFSRYAIHRLLSVWLAGPDPNAETEEQELARISDRSGPLRPSPRAQALLAEIGARTIAQTVEEDDDGAPSKH